MWRDRSKVLPWGMWLLPFVLGLGACSGEDLVSDSKVALPTRTDSPQGGPKQVGSPGGEADLPQNQDSSRERNATLSFTPAAMPGSSANVTTSQASGAPDGTKVTTFGAGPNSGTTRSSNTSSVIAGGPDANLALVAHKPSLPAAPIASLEAQRAKFCTVRVVTSTQVSAAWRLSKVLAGAGFTSTPLPADTVVAEGTQFLVNDISAFMREGQEGYALVAYAQDNAGNLLRFDAELPSAILESECRSTKGRYFSISGTENAVLRSGAMGSVSKALYLKSAFP